jgi:hypothetical protein
MHTNVWLKYLPVLRIVIKRSLTAEQKLVLNTPDFKQAGFTRKTGYKFLIKVKNGRLSHVLVDEPVASYLATALMDDSALKEVLAGNEFHLSLNAKYELTVRHIVQKDRVPEEAIAAGTA